MFIWQFVLIVNARVVHLLQMIGSRLSQRFGRVSYLMAIFLLLLGKQTKSEAHIKINTFIN